MATRVWGPVLEERARELGALAAASSVLLKPTDAPEDLLSRVRDTVPSEVLPVAGDTADTLRDRMKNSAFLHDSWVLKKGNGKGGYIRLNSTKYSQPRRVRWSTPASDSQVSSDGDGDRLFRGLAYPHYYTRSPLDATCEPMPAAIQELSRWCHGLAQPFLAPGSCGGAPNSVELCLYYTAFKSQMGRHRDNFVSSDLTTYLASRDSSILNSGQNTQVPNSNVLIWSMGNAPMVLQLSYPAYGRGAGDRRTYTCHPEFSVPCGDGTLFIFSPLDDLFYAHQACFSDATLVALGDSGYRAAFVMRWLDEARTARTFHVSGERRGSLSPSEREIQEEAIRVAAAKKRRRKAHQHLCG